MDAMLTQADFVVHIISLVVYLLSAVCCFVFLCMKVKCTGPQSQRPLSDVDSDAKNELLSLPMLSKPDIKPAGKTNVGVLENVLKCCVFSIMSSVSFRNDWKRLVCHSRSVSCYQS